MAELPPIVIEIETSASTDEAWAALTDPERVVLWFTDATPVGAVGEPYRLDFGDGSVVDGVVREVVPGRRFAHTWAWADVDPRQETLVTWSVEPRDDGGSRVSIVHDGWSEAGADAETRADHQGYWAGYLEDLAAILAESA
jgi:uncharacterized protein YndB with AHSA1/START domain